MDLLHIILIILRIIIYFYDTYVLFISIIMFCVLAGAADPTYLKKGFADKLVMAAGLTGLFIGTTNILYGLYSMSLGINKAK